MATLVFSDITNQTQPPSCKAQHILSTKDKMYGNHSGNLIQTIIHVDIKKCFTPEVIFGKVWLLMVALVFLCCIPFQNSHHHHAAVRLKTLSLMIEMCGNNFNHVIQKLIHVGSPNLWKIWWFITFLPMCLTQNIIITNSKQPCLFLYMLMVTGGYNA